MRELVVKYLNKQISRRSFVGGLTKAGITMTAAQGVLASVSSVSVAQTGPAPHRPPARRCAAAPATGRTGDLRRSGEGGAGHRRRRLRRAAHRLGREIRVRQFRQRGRRVLRGAGRPPAAQIHPDAARRTRRRDGRRLRQGVGRAHDRDAGRGGRHVERHRPDDQRLQGADAAGGLLLPLRPVAAAPAATASRRCRTRSRSSSRSPSTPGWRAAPT